MTSNSDFKIRVLPRPDEARRTNAGARADSKPERVRRPWRRPPLGAGLGVVVMGVAAVALVMAFRAPPAARSMASQQPAKDQVKTKIDTFLQDVRLKEEGLRQRRRLENMRLANEIGAGDVVAGNAPELGRSYGVQMDSENTADQLYEELNDRKRVATDMTPDERINAMLEKNKWLNQQERQERVSYVRNFIKTAYDRGFEVDLDQNLRVVGVRPIANRRVSLDQVIDKVGQQGF